MNIKIQDYSAESRSTVPPIFIDYLKSRGIAGSEAVQRFLYPSLADLPKPEQMLNLAAAARLAVEFMIAGKQIIIWGDYDVDGTTGTALLGQFLQRTGNGGFGGIFPIGCMKAMA